MTTNTTEKKCFYKNVGETIKNIRQSLGITQSELAEKLNITPQQVSKYENGEDKVSICILCNIADIFQCDIDVILPQQKYNRSALLKVSENNSKFNFGDNKKDKNTKAMEILKIFFKLSKEKQDELIERAHDMLKT